MPTTKIYEQAVGRAVPSTRHVGAYSI